MEVDEEAAAGRVDEKEEEKVVLSPFLVGDINAYVARLESLPRWVRCRRLLSVGEMSLDENQKQAALEACIREAKLGTNTSLYRRACELSHREVDVAWIQSTDDNFRCGRDRLETEVSARRSGPKEAVWDAYGALGDMLMDRGDAGYALKCFLRMRDYASNAQKSLKVCCKIATAAAVHVASNDQTTNRNWAHLTSNTAKAEFLDGNSKYTSKLKVAAGLAHLQARQFDVAARRFIDVLYSSIVEEEEDDDSPGSKQEEDDEDLATLREVSMYASICALATFSRNEIKSECVEHPRFKKAVHQHCPEALEMLERARCGEYGAALDSASRIRDELRLDPFASRRADRLFDLVADKCIAQFCRPYSAVSIDHAASTFNMSPQDFEDRVVSLIYKGRIDAKVDSINRTLLHQDSDKRQVSLDAIARKGRDVVFETETLLFRMACYLNDISVKSTSSSNILGDDDDDDQQIQRPPQVFDYFHRRGSNSRASSFGRRRPPFALYEEEDDDDMAVDDNDDISQF